MRHWIVLIALAGGGWLLWNHLGGPLPSNREPATPEVAWYQDSIEHHFAIVAERGHAFFFRGYHENLSDRVVLQVTVKIYMREGESEKILDTYRLGMLEEEQRKTFDNPIRVPRNVDKPKLRWEIVDVRYR